MATQVLTAVRRGLLHVDPGDGYTGVQVDGWENAARLRQEPVQLAL
ncbi:hypothetical protein [[Kitasatospora] papulosa]